ncbi:MAG: hypothetical protein J0I07_15765 [Myxococcales bacterium]|nr:hypothetical protein [Myxococcales bacterium]
MRRVLFGSLVATVLAGAACASDPPAAETNHRPDSGEVTAPDLDLDGGGRPPFEVPSCIVATGDAAEAARTLEDDTGSASVEVEGTGCERSFVLTSSAARKDDLPVSPRPVSERSSRGGPSLQTTSPLFDALYQLALEEAAENSVDSIRDYAFNDGADLACAPGGCFETGRKWSYVWTRDTAYATHLGLPWVDAVRAKNSLELKISTRRDGSDLQIVQDTGTGGSYPVSTDRAVWALGASEVLLHLDGAARANFRDRALEAAKNTIAHDRIVVFDERDGLYRGEQSFLDWREQTYPGWASPDTVHIGMSKSLSTNVAHLSLLDLAAALAEEAGDGGTASTMKARATELRKAIRARFWLTEEKQLSTFVTTELDPSPVRRFDLLGTSLAVLLDVTTPEQAKDAIATYPTLPKGPPVIFPQQKDTAIYHNRAIWPFVTAYWVKAAKKVGNDVAFEAGMRSLVRGAALNLSNMENLEVVTGKPFHEDGPYSGPVVNSQRQLWSVAGYIGAVNGALFGVEPVSGGVRVAPFVPRALRASLLGGAKTIALNDLPLRGKKLSVSVKLPDGDEGTGGAYTIASRRLNGQLLDGDVIPDAELRDRNLVEVELAVPASPAAALRKVDDVSDYRVLFAPRTPRITGLGVSGGKLTVSADFAGESSSEITWSVYRDGTRVASGLSANVTTWTDASTSGDASPSHCYTVETRWGTSGNVSQHANPACFWGPGSSRVASVPATSFTVTGGNLVTAHGRTFPESWGDPGHEIVATFGASRTGAHLVQAIYGNGAGPISTGITCAVKKVTVEELPSGKVVGAGILVMPQRGDWASWGDSSFVRVNLEAGKSYRVRVGHDSRSVNMSAFEHFSAYTGGTGGKAGAFHRVNIAELKLLAL